MPPIDGARSTAALDALRAFRERFYGCLGARADASLELCDALLSARRLPSPVHLSLEPVHRRGWGSLYAALRRGSINEEEVKHLLAAEPLDRASTHPPVHAVDVSVWSRCDAEASPERGFYYHPSRHSAGQPIVAGWAYQWVAELGFSRNSWVAPMDARRVHPLENTNGVAVEQVSKLLEGLSLTGNPRSHADGEPPLFAFDAGYDAIGLTRSLECYPAQILVG